MIKKISRFHGPGEEYSLFILEIRQPRYMQLPPLLYLSFSHRLVKNRNVFSFD